MSQYQITCTNQEPRTAPTCIAHIVQVGAKLANANQAPVLWTVTQVYAAMDRGDTFWTFSPSAQKWAQVHKHRCACGRATLRSAADAVRDNNLDNLPRCS